MDFSYHFSVLSWLHNDSLFKSNLQSWILKGWFHQSLYRLSKWFKVFFEWQSRHKYQLPPQYCYYYVTQRVKLKQRASTGPLFTFSFYNLFYFLFSIQMVHCLLLSHCHIKLWLLTSCRDNSLAALSCFETCWSWQNWHSFAPSNLSLCYVLDLKYCVVKKNLIQSSNIAVKSLVLIFMIYFENECAAEI